MAGSSGPLLSQTKEPGLHLEEAFPSSSLALKARSALSKGASERAEAGISGVVARLPFQPVHSLPQQE
jgi:hypothetical protein